VNNQFDAIVVGCGAMGSAACMQLAQRGAKVLGLEQFDIPHALGSSHGYSRMIRLAYYEHPDYVPLLRRAYALWDQLEKVSGQKLLYLTGGIYMGPPAGEVVSGALKAARMHGLEHELLERKAISQRFPQFSLPEDFVGVWEPQAGFLLPEKVISAHCEQALRAGAELHGREKVLQWRDGWVKTDKGEYRARKIIFCGGAWSGKLLSELGVELAVTRQPLGWVWPSRPEMFELGKMPVWGIEAPDGSLSYGFPMMSDNPGLKIARHGRGKATDADLISRQATAADEEEIQAVVNRHLPDGRGPTLAIRICMYTNSPDSHFIIDELPGHSNVVIACGFSGHGFKFASVIGEVLADLALNGRTKLPVEFLKLSRFSTNAQST
jgi:sarcosine oxidase